MSAEAIVISASAKASVSFWSEARSFCTVDVSPADANWDFLLSSALREASMSGVRFWMAAMMVLESAEESCEVTCASEVPCWMDLLRVDSVLATGLGGCQCFREEEGGTRETYTAAKKPPL